MGQDQVTNSSISIFKWIYIDNIFKQTCSSHNWIIIFLVSWNLKTAPCMYPSTWLAGAKYDSLKIQVTFYLLPPWYRFHPPSWSCVFAWWSRYSVEDLMLFVDNSTPSYSFSFAYKNCLRCLVKRLPKINSIYHPK